jgi:hypothetical protein
MLNRQVSYLWYLCLLAKYRIAVVVLGLNSLLLSCQPTMIGVACQNNADCERGLFCDLGSPNGYCTMNCSEALPCPIGSICAVIELDNTSDIQRCLQECGVDRDCRLGYKCQLFSAGQKRACFLEQIE